MHGPVAKSLQIGVAAVCVTLAVAWFIVVDASSHSARDTLRPWLIGFALIALGGAALVMVLGRLSRHG